MASNQQQYSLRQNQQNATGRSPRRNDCATDCYIYVGWRGTVVYSHTSTKHNSTLILVKRCLDDIRYVSVITSMQICVLMNRWVKMGINVSSNGKLDEGVPSEAFTSLAIFVPILKDHYCSSKFRDPGAGQHLWKWQLPLGMNSGRWIVADIRNGALFRRYMFLAIVLQLSNPRMVV